MLHFEVKNLGPIAEGAVDLKPLTLLIGSNSTGKSYFATMVYAMLKSFMQIVPLRHFRQSLLAGLAETLNEKKAIRESWEKWVLEHVSFGTDVDVPLAAIGADLKNILKKAITTYIQTKFAEALTSEVSRCYGANISEIVRQGKQNGILTIAINADKPRLHISFSSASVVVSPFQAPVPRWLSLPKLELKNIQSVFEFPRHDIRIKTQPLLVKTKHPIGQSSASELAHLLLVEIAWQVFFEAFLDLISEAYYLPAARSGILQGQKGLARYAVERAPLAGIVAPPDIPPFAGVVADFLGTVLTIEPDEKPHLTPLAELLETEVTKGKIFVESQKHLYPEFFYEAEGVGKLALSRASSGISELAPMVLFLKHVVDPSDILIIEEPEAHLHPAAQRRLARVLVRLVRADVKLLVTTHSDYLVQQLSNFVALGGVEERERAKEGYQSQEYLNAEEVGAYLFRYDEAKGGSVVDKVEVSHEEGIHAEEFGKVAEELYEQSVNLQEKVLRDR